MPAANRHPTLRYTFLQGCYWACYCCTITFSSVYLLSQGFSNAQIGVLISVSGILATMGFGPANAYALMVFCLLYIPCTATIATIHRELESWKQTIGIILFQLLIAWGMSCLVYHIGLML